MKYILAFFCFSLTVLTANAQETGILYGIVVDNFNQPVANANISCENCTELSGTTSNSDGTYQITIDANKNQIIEFSHASFKSHTRKFKLKPNQRFQYNPILNEVELKEIDLALEKEIKESAKSIFSLPKEKLERIPSLNDAVRDLILSLPSVSASDESSSQYSVRGGNFDENLIYVNGIEIYKPFLVRSGQQEGMSFLNSEMVNEIQFSAGGFAANYGDKLSSVLDITYKKPESFETFLKLNFFGAQLNYQNISKNKKFRSLLGFRYEDNSLVVKSKETTVNFNPSFTDIQGLLTYDLNEKSSLEFLGNLAQNKYDYKPSSSLTKFGTIAEAGGLVVNYNGNESDQFLTKFGALKYNLNQSDSATYNLISSAYHTQEEEYFDIIAQYNIGDVDIAGNDGSQGEIINLQDSGSQQDHARNDLDALIFNLEARANYHLDNNDEVKLGLKYTYEDIRDNIIEWQMLDSLGFSVRPPEEIPNTQPYEPYLGPIIPFQNIRERNFVNTSRVSGFAQFEKNFDAKKGTYTLNSGIRSQFWQTEINNIKSDAQVTISPRFILTYKPELKDSTKTSIFKIASGLYHQPPFYKEMRNAFGIVDANVKAQQSLHFVLGNDYWFNLFKDDRRFKLSTEAYYKHLTNVNSYSVDNVRINYSATNDTKAFATGFDARLNGEFINGIESWISLGILSTKENQQNRGYIARPTDQRFKFALLFQDYMPNIENLRLYLNMNYNAQLPSGSPTYADPYLFSELRLKEYIRTDVGFSLILKDQNDFKYKGKSKTEKLKLFKEFSLGFEIFNLFDADNQSSTIWIKELSTNGYQAIPNRLAPRIFNLTTSMRF